MINLSLQCCVTVELPRVQYINLSEIAHVVKAVLIVNDALLNLSMLLCPVTFLSAKVSPEWRLNPGFGTHKVSPSLE